MGGNMTRRLLDGGHDVVVWDQNVGAVQTIGRSGATGAASISDLVRN
jgi:6-phosphogluconate dehydrogenase